MLVGTDVIRINLGVLLVLGIPGFSAWGFGFPDFVFSERLTWECRDYDWHMAFGRCRWPGVEGLARMTRDLVQVCGWGFFGLASRPQPNVNSEAHSPISRASVRS